MSGSDSAENLLRRNAILRGALLELLEHPEVGKRYARAALDASRVEMDDHFVDLMEVARYARFLVSATPGAPESAKALEHLEAALRRAGFFSGERS